MASATLHLIGKCLLLATGYFLAGKLGLSLPYIDSHITLLWLPTGIATAALLRWGISVWPGVFLGSLLVNLTVPSSPELAISIAVGNTLGPMLTATLLKRSGISWAIDQPRGIFLLIVCAGLGMLLSAGGGVTSLFLLGNLPAPAIAFAGLTWWAGDFVGILLAAPLLLNVSRAALARLWQRRLEYAIWLGLACALGWGIFVLNNDASGNSLPLVFLMLPIVVWSAMRFEITGASLGTLICMFMAVVATSFGLGPFHLPQPQQGLFVMWAFLAMLVLVQLMVTALQTQRQAAEERFRNLAFFDPLTKLPNRNLLMDHLRLALLTSIRNRRHGALIFLDLDHFKNINDTHGHDAGDQLLREVAGRLLPCVRQSDTVARLGGDEFVLILEHLDEDPVQAALQAGQVAEKIRSALARPYKLTPLLHQNQVTIDYHSTVSIGISLFRDRRDQLDELLKRADLTLYQAKAAGRNTIRFFEPAMQLAVENRAKMQSNLHRAIENHELRLYFQLQLDHHRRVIGCEALLRWQDDTQGTVSPAEFIPLAEETGLILLIGNWVTEQACLQLKTWSDDPETRHLSVSINVSAREFREPGFVAQIASALQRHAITPALLKLELTEGVVINDVADAVAKMHQLKQLGITLSLDDFGTGYSSLSYLQHLPLDQLKIDQSFVRNLDKDASNAAIVRTIITLGNSLGLDVIAEGVETPEQHAHLVAQGCRSFQGYLFSYPEPAAAIPASMRRLASLAGTGTKT